MKLLALNDYLGIDKIKYFSYLDRAILINTLRFFLWRFHYNLQISIFRFHNFIEITSFNFDIVSTVCMYIDIKIHIFQVYTWEVKLSPSF